jgi:phosphoribosylaminoimidazolecarboxamide formyltransferase/IMP cyclohydrolase
LSLIILQVAAGWLSQDADSLSPEEVTFTVVSEAKPTAQQLQDIKFAWR